MVYHPCLQSSPVLGFGFCAGLGVTCFTFVGKPLDSLSPCCEKKMLLDDNCKIRISCWKVVCPCEICEVKGLCGKKKIQLC